MRLPFLALLLTVAVLPLRAEKTQTVSPLAGTLRKSGLPEAAASVTIPLKSTFLGFMVEVRIDGKPVELVLDTGSAATLLFQETAGKLGLKAENFNDLAGSISGGRFAVQRAMTRRITLGEAWTANEPVFVARMLPGHGEGLLGISTLADWDVRIDPAAKTLTLFPAGQAPALAGESVLPLVARPTNPAASVSNPQGLRLINPQVPVRVGTNALPAVPDTGFGGILQLPGVLMEKIAPEAMKNALPALATGTSMSGRMVTRTAKLPQFTFGPDTLRGLSTDVVDARPGSSIERKAILGLNLLRHYVMTFRFSAGELRLKPLGTVQEITRTSTAGIHMAFGPGGILVISSVVPDGPADTAGLRAGDELVEIEGRVLKTMKPEEFAAFKRLPPGSKVKVRYRRGEAEPIEATLVLVKE